MKLSEWRKSNGLSQSALGSRCGLAGPYISQIEAGVRRPSPEAAGRIEAVTNSEVTAAELLGIKEVGVRSGIMEEAKIFDFGTSDDALLKEAASYGLNASEIARAAVERAVKTERMKRFSEENREAIESWNEHYKKHGLWNEKYRLF